MLSLDTALRDHLAGRLVTLAVCWVVEKRNGQTIRGTNHDRDLVIAAGDYAGTYLSSLGIGGSDVVSKADAAVDNMDVQGTTVADSIDIGISVLDIEAGFLKQAPVTMFIVNWQAPDDGELIRRHGYLGEISRDSDGRYTTELRGLKQLLSQVFVRTYSDRCEVKRFGDNECGKDLGPITATGTVTAVTNGKRFDATLTGTAMSDSYFDGGELTFTTGDNAGVMRECKRGDNDDVLGHLSTWERFPVDPQIGDEFTLTPGCDRTAATCQNTHDNLINHRAYGLYIPGADALTRGPL